MSMASCPCRSLLAATAQQISEGPSLSTQDVWDFLAWRSNTDPALRSQLSLPLSSPTSTLDTWLPPSSAALAAADSEPAIAPNPVICEAFVDNWPVRGLVDSGAQADVLSSDIALALGLELHRLIAPVHAELGVDGHTVRLALYTRATFRSGQIDLPSRPFFVGRLPTGIDLLLGLPWMRDTGVSVSANSVFITPNGPHAPVIDLASRRFNDQPAHNLKDLGFVESPMSTDDQHRLALCAIAAETPHLDEWIDFEPRNPLLDVTDDPSLPDLTTEEADTQVALLMQEFSHVLVDELPTDSIPPFRPVNHSIPLIDESLVIRPRSYPIPDRYKEQFAAHLNKYVESGQWSPQALESACAMFAIPKHDRTQGRFVVNLKPRNANTRKMQTPLPDMRSMRITVASHPYRSQLDFKAAFEQVRIIKDHVPHTGFATPLGTFLSNVMQFGDCNAPDTMHRLCYMMFRRYIGRFLEGFYDDWFVFSHTRRAHLRYLRIIFTTLEHYRFFLSRSKVHILSPSLGALGSVISDDGISVDPDKWTKIRDWPTPRSPQDILRFMGLATWMSDHLPHLSELAAPLTRLTGKVDWDWTPLCDAAFTAIKDLIPATLRPLDWSKVDNGSERVFVFTDASIYGVGGWLGQGTARDTAVPFRFHSAKFNSAQLNYSTTDQELLAVLDTVTKFSDHLLGRQFTVVSDHLPLQTYWTQPPKPTRRHVRTWQQLSQFSFDWEFIEGRKNKLADSLSRLYEIDGAPRMDPPEVAEPDLDDCFDDPFIGPPTRDTLVSIAALTSASRTVPRASSHRDHSISPQVVLAPLALDLDPSELIPLSDSTANAAKSLPPESRSLLLTQLPPAFMNGLPDALKADSLFGPVIAKVADYPSFALVDDILFLEDQSGWRLVVPSSLTTDTTLGAHSPSFREAIINHGHEVLGHLGPRKTLSYLRHFFWWPLMHKDVFDYCRSCEQCARGKTGTQRPFGLLHPLPIPSRPWSWAALDFMVGLPPVLYHGSLVDSLLTVTDLFSKMVHLFPLSTSASAADVAEIYHDGIYRLHGMQATIVSDRDPKFTGGFWQALHRKIGTKLAMSTSAHPQTDGASEVTNKTAAQILRIFVEDNPDDWALRTPDAEFAINAAAASATGLSPFEVAYGYLPTAWPVDSWSSTDVPTADGFGELVRLNWLRATDALISSRISMTTSDNRRRRPDAPEFQSGNMVYVSSKDLAFPSALSRKFIPRYVGLYKITEAHPSSSTYTIEFPPHFRIHSRIHASKLRPFFPNDDARFPSRRFDALPPDVPATDANDAVYLLEKVVADKLVGKRREFLVRYLGYSAGEDRWIPESELAATAAELLTEYVARKGGSLAMPKSGRTRRAGKPKR
jgi:hypothetical protein